MPDLRTYNPIWLQTTPIAHRGLHGPGVPENSLAAFRAAADASYAIELDVRLSSDRQLVVLHDSNTQRMTGEDHAVAATSAALLTPLRLGNSGETIPLLSDVFATVSSRVPIYIEIKKGAAPAVIGSTILALLRDYQGEIAVASFDPRILTWFRRHAPSIPRIQIASSLPEKHQPLILKRLLRAMPLNFLTRPAAIAFDVRDYPTATLKFWQRVLRVPVLLWAVTNQHQLDAARRHRLNVIFEKFQPQHLP